MANAITITDLTEILYQARDTVAAEPFAFINSVTVNAGSQAVSLGGTVKSTVTAQPTLNTSHTPATTVPAGDDTTISTEEMTIGQVARTNIPIKGEIARQLGNIGEYGDVIKQLFAQHIRTHRNAIESHCGTVIKNGSSRAVGTAGTTPFASTHAVIPQAHQILKDNGAPQDGQVSLVMSTSAGTALKSLSHIYKINESGGGEALRRGILADIDGVMLKESAGVASHTAGTGASYLINDGNIAIGSTALTIDTGTGTILVGDGIALQSDSRIYIAGATSAGTTDLTLQAPGLRQATVNNKTVTLSAAYTGNMMFHRSAVELVMRPPAMPPGGDAATERITVSDPLSGLVFEVAVYKLYGMNMIEFVTYYQAKVWKNDFVATVFG